MVTGPIFRVELVSAARRGRYFAMRVLYAAIILFVLWATYESMGSYRRFSSGGTRASISDMAQTAAGFFVSFSWVQLLGILAVAPAMAVGAIATERERRTIEYLFATDLSNLEIVVGKTLARLLLVGKFVLVSLPILFLFRLLGGIPANLLAGSALIAASTALVVTALSVCVSVWSPRSRDAATRVYRIMFALLILPPIVSGFLGVGAIRGGNWQSYLQPVLGFLNGLNPMLVLGSSMSGMYAMGAGFDFEPVLTMAAWHTAISVALIALATAAVRRVHLRETGGGSASRAVSAPALRRRWLPKWRPALGDNAMLWKEAFAPTSRTRLGWVAGIANVLVVVAALGGILYSFACAMWEIDFWNRESYLWFVGMFTGLVGVGLLLLLAARASGLVTIEKERDCWISLISTPLTGGEIMRGKLLGNLYSMRWGFLLLLTAWLLAAFLDVRYFFVAALMSVVFLLCAWFVTSVGLLYSLRSNTSLRAMGFTLATTLFVGGGYMLCCCPVVAVGGANDDSMVIGMAPCMPFLLTAPAFVFAERDFDGPGEMMFAYVLGVVGYTIACVALMSYFSSGFDAMAGRTVDIADRRNLPSEV